MKNQVWSISALVRYLKHSLDNDMHIQSILIKGEISNFTHHRSGHLYFSLKDNGAKMNCVMFSSMASRLKILPKEGMKVIAQAKVSLYEPQGNLQLYIQHMQSDGIGDLYLQFEALKETLQKQGLFDASHKKDIPLYPNSIGVISARTGAAIQDVLSILARRWPLCDVSVYPSLVQGDSAAQDMIQKLREADAAQHDILLLVRGGGSLEDLWCFNDEALARVIYDLKTCIVTGVGHEIDTTLVDYVSDYRAPTPSAAAEYITPDINEVKEELSHIRSRLYAACKAKLSSQRDRVEQYRHMPMFSQSEYFLQNEKIRFMMLVKGLYSVEDKVTLQRKHWESKEEKLYQAVQSIQHKAKENLQQNIALLDAFSPLKILQRGYSIAFLENRAIRSVEEVQEHDNIMIRINDGTLRATITERKKEHGRNDI